MTEIALPWALLLAFCVALVMAAYHYGRASEARRHAVPESWQEVFIRRSRAGDQK